MWLISVLYERASTAPIKELVLNDHGQQKNKSARVQKQVQQIQAQAAMAGKSKQALTKEREKELCAKEKLGEEKWKKEEAALFKPVKTQKVPFGVDLKTILCTYFKASTCKKGNKCKFSHNVDIGHKVEKKNLYEDSREEQIKGFSVVCCLAFGCPPY